MLFAVFTFIYLIVLLYLILKLRDILSNPEKYNEIKGWDKYRKSFWYEPMSNYHNKWFAKNWLAPIVIGIPVWGIIIACFYFAAKAIQLYLLIPSSAILTFNTDTMAIGITGIIFIAVCFEFWISFNSKLPIMIAATMSAFNSDERSTDWKKLIVTFMIIFAVAFPFYVLSVDDYGYITNEKISYNEYLKFSETDFYFDEITQAETSFHADNNEQEFFFSYEISNSKGDRFDVLEAGRETTAYVHKVLKDRNIPVIKAHIDSDTYQKILDGESHLRLELIQEYFIVEN